MTLLEHTVAQHPLVFVVGCPRSGTTMLERIMDAHPLLAIAHETHWITRYAHRSHGVSKNGRIAPDRVGDLLDTLYDDRRFVRMGIDRAELEAHLAALRRATYSDLIAFMYARFAAHAGKPLSGDKSTGGYLRNLPALYSLCSTSRFVYLIRDGRDICLSMLNWSKAARAAGRLEMWNQHPVATTALWWRWHAQSAAAGSRAIPSDLYHEVRYEHLVDQPESVCRTLCDFLDIPFDTAMLAYHVGRFRSDPSLTSNQAWLPPTRGRRDWRTQMAPEDIEMFEALAGDELERLGYERGTPRISPEIQQRAEALMTQWHETHASGAR